MQSWSEFRDLSSVFFFPTLVRGVESKISVNFLGLTQISFELTGFSRNLRFKIYPK